MCLIYIIAALGVGLTILSGQYSQHTVLFWALIGCAAATGVFYSLAVKAEAGPKRNDLKTMFVLKTGNAVFAITTLALFIGIVVAIWVSRK